MKKVLFAAALVAIAAPVQAADMPVKAPASRMVAPTIYDWSGLYLGLQAGYGWGNKVWENPGTPLADYKVSGAFGGGQIGFNYQIGQFVVGLEGDLVGAGIKGSGVDPFGDVLASHVDWLGTVTGRGGVAFDRVLVYGKGGAAWAGDRFSFVAPSGRNAETKQTRGGWTAGAGLEYAFARGWSGKIEYDYMDFGTKHVTFVTGDFADIRQTVNLIKVGVNYKFDWARR